MLTGVSISINLASVLQHLDRMRSIAQLKPVAHESSLILERLHRKYTPVSHDPNQRFPGKLRASWKGETKVEESRARILIQVQNRDPRAGRVWPLLVTGTHSHLIQAKRAKLLVFRFRSGDLFVGPRVMHRGAKKAVDIRSMNKELQTELIRLKKRIAEVLAK